MKRDLEFITKERLTRPVSLGESWWECVKKKGRWWKLRGAPGLEVEEPSEGEYSAGQRDQDSPVRRKDDKGTDVSTKEKGTLHGKKDTVPTCKIEEAKRRKLTGLSGRGAKKKSGKRR